MTGSLATFDKLIPNPDWAKLPLFDRKGWTKVRFGDVVRMLKEQVDPVAKDIERYVAGEHMETENIHIQHWGNVGEGYLGPAFIRRFRKGQVLYGSRRTYLKKVAVAEWDGVTANTTFVLEAVEGRMLQQLLPWLMLSERFTNHSIQESKGSTNPYINFPDIAKFEFDLPPLDQQRRIAEILWAVDESIGATLALLTSMEATHDAEFQKGQANGATSQRIENFTSLISDGDHNPPKRTPTGVPHVLVQNIRDGKIDLSNCTFVSKADFERVKERYLPRKNDLLIVCVGATIGRAGMVRDLVEFSTDRSIAVVRFDPTKVMPEYGFALVTSHSFQVQIQRNSVGTAQPHLFLGDIRRIKVAIPPISEQHRVIEVLGQLGSARKAATQNLSCLRKLREQLSLAIFEGKHAQRV